MAPLAVIQEVTKMLLPVCERSILEGWRFKFVGVFSHNASKLS